MTEKKDISAQISREMVRLQAEYYDREPEAARTYYVDDLVLVCLKEVFSKAEQALIEHGDVIAVQHIRRRFQQKMAQDFKSIVERATGREVSSFLSETNVEEHLSVEVFFLAGDLQSMAAFERSAEAE